ncbi:MAG: hypothetical protein R2882_07820 [Gemmatimonadales bacterium]
MTRGRTARFVWWNTQDYAAAVRAVDAWQRRFPASSARPVGSPSGGNGSCEHRAWWRPSVPLAKLTKRAGPLDLEDLRPARAARPSTT